MSKLKVGQTVYAVKQPEDKHEFGYVEDMGKFADGAKGVIKRSNPDGSVTVSVQGVDINYTYAATEVSTVPRGTKVTKFVPMQTKPTKNLSVKPVDIKLKTLYVVVKDGKPVYTTTKRSGARAKKLSLGGLKAGVTIVTYKPQNEIR